MLKTAEDVADYFKVSKAAVYQWVEDGRLHAVRAGRLLRFRDEDLERFLDQEARPRSSSRV